MKVKSTVAERMCALFGGARATRYQPGLTNPDASGKVRPRKIDEWCGAPTVELWEQHLSGKIGLGIIPVDGNGKVRFGAIDVDSYDEITVDQNKVIEQIYREKLPVIPCRSKSRGLHLIFFLTEPVLSCETDQVLRNIAARLGLKLKVTGGQTEIITTTNLWMPFYGGHERVAIKRHGLSMSAAEFVNVAETASLHPGDMAKWAMPPRKQSNSTSNAKGTEYASRRLASYCAELTGMNDGEGRNSFLNKALHEMGRMVGAGWIDRENVEQQLRQAAQSVGMESKKTDAMIRRKNGALDRGMKEPPPSTSVSDSPIIVGWRKLESENPVWFITLEGSSNELELKRVDDLTNYRRFADQCAKQLNRFFSPMKVADWADVLQEAQDRLVVERAAEDTTRVERFRELLEEMLTDRSRGERREDILSGRPFEDLAKRRHEFTMRMVEGYVVQSGMRDISRHECEQFIKQLGGNRVSKNPTTLLGKGVRLWFVPSDAVQATPQLPLPTVREEAEI